MTAPISSAAALSIIKQRLATDLTIRHSGQSLRLMPGGALSGVSEDLTSLSAALAALTYTEGMTIVLARDPPPGCGDDHVTAINLSRPIAPVDAREVARAVKAAADKYPGAREVQVNHYIGGPCDPEEISTCVVPGGAGCGWTIVGDLSEAIELAHARAYQRSEGQGSVHGGQSVRLTGLQARPDLNGEAGIAMRFIESSGRWLVRLKGGEGKQLKPANLEPIGPTHGVVHCVWGDAQWSRTQLLGEIARGHWGLCRASVAEIVAEPAQRREALDGRLVFAPATEMMEDFIRRGVEQMEREAALNGRYAERAVAEDEEADEGGGSPGGGEGGGGENGGGGEGGGSGGPGADGSASDEPVPMA